MKPYALILTIFCMAVTGTAMDSRPALSSEDIHNAIVNYEYGLFSENISVVKSSMKNAVLFHARYPEHDFGKIAHRLDYLVVSADSPVVRHQAYIASLYFRNPNWITEAAVLELGSSAIEPSSFFKELYIELETRLFAGK